MFLTPDELRELTGRRRPSAQVRWLRDHCWTFAERADGRPAVSRREAERQLETGAAARRATAPAAELQGEIDDLLERIETTKARKLNAERRAADFDARSKAEQERLEALPPLAIAPDTAALKARIADARARNRELDERERVLKERERLEAEAKAAEEQSATYTARIERRNKEAADAIAAAKLPVEGLGFGDDAVLLNGLPFDQASSAEQLRVSVAIAAARNSKLRVIHVRDGSLLDDDSMELLREFAQAHDMQVWVERVASDSPVGIVIEDGRIKAASDDGPRL